MPEKTLKRAYKGFTREAVEALSGLKDEPGWMLQRRLEAWRVYEETPMPRPDEELWRRTDISGLHLDEVAPFAEPVASRSLLRDVPEAAQALLPDGSGAGVLVHHSGWPVYQRLAEGLASKGVVFTSLEAALRDCPDLVREYLMGAAVPAAEGKFAALSGALWSGGTLVHVPPGVQVDVPLYALVWAGGPDAGLFPRTVIVAETGSSVVVVEEYVSPDSERQGLACPVVEVYAQEGARVRYAAVSRWGNGTYVFSTQRVLVERNALVETLAVSLGGKLTKAKVEGVLRGPGAHSEMFGLTFGAGDQHFDYNTFQQHLAPHTYSNLEYRVALKGRSRSIYYGVVRILKGAQQTDAYQSSRALLLSEKAKADSIPVLEIEADDVHCKHGAAIGPVDEEQLFYLMSRGLDPQAAEEMLVKGFFDPIIQRMPAPWLQERLQGYVASRITRE